MSDQQAIRVESCRGDGRCPTCGSQARDVRLVCGCLAHAYCASLHQRALLTEALRQLSDQRERGDQAEAARITEQRDCREVVQRVEGERDAWWRKYNAAKVAADVMEGERDATIADAAGLRESRDEAWARTEFVTQERDAAIRELAALREAQNDDEATERERARLWNDLVRERDEAVRERDADAQSDAILRRQYLKEAEKQRERAEKAEALLRRAAAWIGDGLVEERLLSEIREALS